MPKQTGLFDLPKKIFSDRAKKTERLSESDNDKNKKKKTRREKKMQMFIKCSR